MHAFEPVTASFSVRVYRCTQRGLLLHLRLEAQGHGRHDGEYRERPHDGKLPTEISGLRFGELAASCWPQGSPRLITESAAFAHETRKREMTEHTPKNEHPKALVMIGNLSFH
jgi:hypothetical protein